MAWSEVSSKASCSVSSDFIAASNEGHCRHREGDRSHARLAVPSPGPQCETNGALSPDDSPSINSPLISLYRARRRPPVRMVGGLHIWTSSSGRSAETHAGKTLGVAPTCRSCHASGGDAHWSPFLCRPHPQVWERSSNRWAGVGVEPVTNQSQERALLNDGQE
jgi:hypothetical protein